MRALKAREALPERLTEAGALVAIAPAYETRRPDVPFPLWEELLRPGSVDLITFTSSSTASNFKELAASLPQGEAFIKATPAACIGPITAETARACGFDVRVEAKSYTIPALAQAIADYFRTLPPDSTQGSRP